MNINELKSYEFSLNKIDLVLSDVKIYPNLMKDYITIQNFSGGRIVVRNTLGEKVLERDVYNNAEMINVSQFKVGIYFIELKINGYRLNKKIIKI